VTINFNGHTALITGASSGLGAEFARTLAARGANLVLVARRGDLLDALATTLRREHGVTVTTIATDLGRPGVATDLRAQLAEKSISIQTLINNAGFGTYGPFVGEDPERIAAEVQLNIATLVELTHTFLPDLLATNSGVLLNVASTSAFQATPNMAVYGASKSFVLSFTEAIAYEARTSGLHVLALCPGSTRTEFFDVVGSQSAAVGAIQTPSQVVATAMRALDKQKTPAYVVSGFPNKLSALLSGLAPRSVAVSAAGRLLVHGRGTIDR
jgi:uncharacterized protein